MVRSPLAIGNVYIIPCAGAYVTRERSALAGVIAAPTATCRTGPADQSPITVSQVAELNPVKSALPGLLK